MSESAIPDFSERAAIDELMDDGSIGASELRQTLIELEDINRKLGGYAVSLSGVERLVPAECPSFTLLDVGTGGGDFAREIGRWAARRGQHARVRAIDVSPTILDLARERERRCDRTLDGVVVEYQVADLLELSNEEPFDVVHAGLLLHHFNGDAARTALAKMLALSRWGVVINDLHRHPLAYHSIRWLTRWHWRNRLIRHDAPVSVLRAFRRGELEKMASSLDCGPVDIRWCWAFRWRMILTKRRTREVQTREDGRT